MKKVIVSVNPEFFSLEAVLESAESLTDKAYILFDGDIDSEYKVEIIAKKGHDSDKLALEFNNLLISSQVYLLKNKNNITEKLVKETMEGVGPDEEH